MTDQLKLMKQALGEGSSDLLDTIRVAFEHMDIAEEEIAASGCTEEQGQAAFAVLCPSEPLEGKCDAVYRGHCKELLARVMANDDTRLGTDAEVLCCLLGASLKAPLDASGSALADHLFAQLFPDHPVAKSADRAREFYNGQVAEDLAEARKRCGVRYREAKVPS